MAERSASWNAKPENRHLAICLGVGEHPGADEEEDWTEPQRKMMKRAGRVYGLEVSWDWLSWLLDPSGSPFVGRSSRASKPPGFGSGGVDSRRWTRQKFLPSSKQLSWLPPLGLILALGACWYKVPMITAEHLHASLALLPVDASQVDYLFNRLLKATPSELPVLRDALKTHRSTLTPKLWTVLESAKPGDASLLPSARPWQATTRITPGGKQ